VVDLLVESFPRILDYTFTAQMETKLDDIEEGKADWLDTMQKFYGSFAKWLEKARDKMRNIKAMEEPTEISCEKCGRSMVIKWGRFGKFLACSGIPSARTPRSCPATRPPRPAAAATATARPSARASPARTAASHGAQARALRAFLACSGYPDCRTVVRIGKAATPPPEPTDETCEKCGAPW